MRISRNAIEARIDARDEPTKSLDETLLNSVFNFTERNVNTRNVFVFSLRFHFEGISRKKNLLCSLGRVSRFYSSEANGDERKTERGGGQ